MEQKPRPPGGIVAANACSYVNIMWVRCKRNFLKDLGVWLERKICQKTVLSPCQIFGPLVDYINLHGGSTIVVRDEPGLPCGSLYLLSREGSRQ